MTKRDTPITGSRMPPCYALVAARSQPCLDLSYTVGKKCIGGQWDSFILHTMRSHYGRLNAMYRLGSLVWLVSLYLSAGAGRIIGPIVTAMCVPEIICITSMLCVDMITIMVRQAELVFLTLCNVTMWGILGVLVHDARCSVALVGFLLMQIGLLYDASFRTAKKAFKSAIAAAPALIALSIAIFTRSMDISRDDYLVLPVGNLKVDIGDVLLNTNATLTVCVLRRLYKQRSLRTMWMTGIMPCTVYRPTLALQATNGKDDLVLPEPTPELGSSLVRQIMMKPLHTSSIDPSDVVWSSCAPKQPVHLAQRWGLFVLSVVGLSASASAVWFPAQVNLERRVATGEWSPLLAAAVNAIPKLGLSCTFIVMARTLVCCQRQLLWLLVTKFDVFFLSFQYISACAVMIDAFNNDYRSFGVVAWGIWFTAVLLLDALTPCMREFLGLTKKHFALVLFITTGCLGYVLVMIIFFSMDMEDHVIATWEVRHDIRLQMHSKGFLINRMFPVVVWTLRLLVDLLNGAAADLIILKGDAVYSHSLEMFPISKPQTSVSPQAAAPPTIPPAAFHNS